MSGNPDGPAIVLQVTAGPQAGDELRFSDHQTCVVGRSGKAQIRLSDSRRFSRFHCRLEINPPRIVVIDLDSTNGTKVNGRRIQMASLLHGDVVTVGDTSFTVVVLAPEANPEHSDISETITMSPSIAKDNLNAEFHDEDLPEIPGYTIERKLGQGAMGAVFLAHRRSTGDSVAIKVIRPLPDADRVLLDRFRREASIVLRLQHKRIVKCLDFNVAEGNVPYLVMEYVEEIGIQQYLESLQLSERIRVSAGLIVRLLEGLEYAHSREIVHRDVKPKNILVYQVGRKLQLKLADFGLAKNYIDAGFSNCSASDEFCGTLAYMSPEQIMNCRYAKPACDIYAVGVCLYQLISGRLPYESEHTAKQLALILNQPPTCISEHVSTLSAGLQEIISKSLSRMPSDRFASATAMRQQLLPFARRR